ncbi:MAG TPA: peptidoglycan DD-metalloendopeptidase family protein [Candidatus Paceibacterota bacterium]|nr:peptidoglycan DD-metalloendopeptidase family protein [Candidatus Paceibacterota bacterium]
MKRFVLALLLLLAVVSILPAPTHADTVAEIKEQIEEINQQRAALNAEIAEYQRQLGVISGQKQTLQSAIQTIDVSRNKTSAQIRDIQAKISAATLKLSQLALEINNKEDSIALDQAAVASSLRNIHASDDVSLIEQLFAADDLADAWVSVDNLGALNQALQSHANALSEAKTQLAMQQEAVASTKNELSSANVDLNNQKKALDVQKAEKSTLLSQTQSQEAQYQALIAQKRAEEATFEAALFELSSQLKAADNTLVSAPGKGVLAWPLDSIRITQYFGRTSDSGRLYASGTHDGVDFGVGSGTPVKAALSGTVMQINTGAVQNCQYGKWVLIRHDNGLATLYAHLSSISVSSGETVSTGQVVGYSGMTGYATGPHLHFTVYNASSVAFKQYTCKSGYTVTVPIAPPNGYLDPMSYL